MPITRNLARGQIHGLETREVLGALGLDERYQGAGDSPAQTEGKTQH